MLFWGWLFGLWIGVVALTADGLLTIGGGGVVALTADGLLTIGGGGREATFLGAGIAVLRCVATCK